MYRTRCMEVLWGYALGANIQRILKSYWNDQSVVLWYGGYCSRLFKTDQGMTQRDPINPTNFNIVVNSVVQANFMEVYGPH